MAKPHRQPPPGLTTAVGAAMGRLEPGAVGAAQEPDATAVGGAMPPAAADLELLWAEPHRFGLFAALRLVEAAHPDRPRLGEARRARDEPVRLGQPPHLHFPPSQIAGFEAGREGGPPRLLTFAFGLFGPQGPLPLHVSREALARARQRSDPVLADFCDVFHHRLIALYWRAYAAARPAVEQDRPEASRFRRRLAAVAGLSGPGFADRSALPDRFSLFAAGLLAAQGRPAEAVERLVALFFAVPVRLQEFVGAWLDIPPRARTRLGLEGGASRLDVDAVLGTRIHLRHHRVRLVLGPLTLSEFLGFLPDGGARAQLDAMVRRTLGLEVDWDMGLVLRRDQVPKATLPHANNVPRAKTDGGAYLGWTSWLVSRARGRDADDVVLLGSG